MGLLWWRKRQSSPLDEHRTRMKGVLERVATSRLQLSEATSLEELDIARSSMQAAFAEMQSIVRTAKSDVGIALRPVQEVEEEYRKLMDHLRKPRLRPREAPPISLGEQV